MTTCYHLCCSKRGCYNQKDYNPSIQQEGPGRCPCGSRLWTVRKAMTLDQKVQIAALATKVAKVYGGKLHSYEALILPGGPGVSLQIRFQEPSPPPAPRVGKGSVVRLKSGGPRMTVSAIKADKSLVCNWFSEGGSHCGIFQAATLEVVS